MGWDMPVTPECVPDTGIMSPHGCVFLFPSFRVCLVDCFMVNPKSSLREIHADMRRLIPEVYKYAAELGCQIIVVPSRSKTITHMFAKHRPGVGYNVDLCYFQV